MDLNEFQENLKNYENYPSGLGPYYLILGAQSELGKLSEKLKVLLDASKDFDERDKRNLSISIGDIMFYLLSIANSVGIKYEEIAAIELRKQSLIKEQKVKENIKAGS
jgi:NTP pyrophosphatase (non-canonical NTP hydrolase)